MAVCQRKWTIKAMQSLMYHVQIASGFSMFNRLIGYFLKTNLENVEKI